jgi:hypothetical protein
MEFMRREEQTKHQRQLELNRLGNEVQYLKSMLGAPRPGGSGNGVPSGGGVDGPFGGGGFGAATDAAAVGRSAGAKRAGGGDSTNIEAGAMVVVGAPQTHGTRAPKHRCVSVSRSFTYWLASFCRLEPWDANVWLDKQCRDAGRRPRAFDRILKEPALCRMAMRNTNVWIDWRTSLTNV